MRLGDSRDRAVAGLQIGVKAKYGLTVTTKEKRAMLSVLRACPAQAVPEK